MKIYDLKILPGEKPRIPSQSASAVKNPGYAYVKCSWQKSIIFKWLKKHDNRKRKAMNVGNRKQNHLRNGTNCIDEISQQMVRPILSRKLNQNNGFVLHWTKMT